ncbi:hypothetical protein BCR35DRAFT_126778 [Leucosporidium creatinivorum]|uniref:Uncharacterized protein n=1 Tax=Leucosporidium creatinivorum TaxID=106004 RepID=A0A1Y2EVP2_9BASI|nr:hypothetical protein BCR35DRAFT_126778 [Leucosporidium creatinivorum]
MNDASARNQSTGDSPPKTEDQAGSAGDDSSAGPAPKRRKTTKKAAAAAAAAAASTTNDTPASVRNSPPSANLNDLAAIASQISAPSSAAPPHPPHTHSAYAPAIPSPSLPHTHSHQHTHAHPPHAGHAHAHHHHHHHVSPHAVASGRMPLAPPPFASTSASSPLLATTGGLNLDTPLHSLTLRDLVAFHEGLQHELGAMRELMSRTEQHLVQGDRLVGVLQSAIAAAGTPNPPPAPAPAPAIASPRPQEPKEAPPEPIATGTGLHITQGRRTEQDLEEYLAGLPEMAAVPLPLRKKSEGAVVGLGVNGGGVGEKSSMAPATPKVEEEKEKSTEQP